MLKKRMSLILVPVILIGGIVIGKILTSQKQTLQRHQEQVTSQKLELMTVKNEDVSQKITMTGRLRAVDKISLYAEVSGTLQRTKIPFKAGNHFKKGDVLIQIDDEVYRNNVMAEKSSLLNKLTTLQSDLVIDFPKSAVTWETYLRNFDPTKILKPLPEPASEQERYYIAARDIYSYYYSIKSMEATLAKYCITAPYDGVVTESTINPGALVRSGQELGEFVKTGIYEMETYVSVQDVDKIYVGQSVVLKSDKLDDVFDGQISRVNAIVNDNSQTVNVYVKTKDERLKDGMYLSALVNLPSIRNVFSVSKKLLIDDNSLYVLQDSVITLKNIKKVASELSGEVYVRGLEDGTLVLKELPHSIYNGMIYKIDK